MLHAQVRGIARLTWGSTSTKHQQAFVGDLFGSLLRPANDALVILPSICCARHSLHIPGHLVGSSAVHFSLAAKAACGVQAVQTDINRLVSDVQGGNTDAIQADASGLQQQFDALRKAIPRLNAKNSDKATIAEKANGTAN